MIPFLFFAITASAGTFYVDPHGDDEATGDAHHPWQTISRAASWAGPGDKVFIQPGVYREWVGLTKSGEAGKPIVFAAVKPGTAIISGADPLDLFTAIADHPGEYITNWSHDFIIDHNADGSPVRNHGAPAPIGCAEQILWESRPLKQVMQADDLTPGRFYVDWQYHTLTVFLPGGLIPDASHVEGSVRSFLMSPFSKNDVFQDVRYITLRGLVFRDAANFAQRGGVILGSNWRAEDCVAENNNAGGLSLNGDNIVVHHCIARNNGFSGISGGGNNNTIEDCIVHDNNRKGFPPDWEGGGGKFFRSDHLRVLRHLSYDNTGPGLWLDTDNTNYSITDSIFYGNRGLDADWEGIGIFLEISPGPGLVSNNICYSNTGSGINIAESEHVTVEKNLLVDNGENITLRAMQGRDHYKFGEVTVVRNRFKQWRKAAIQTSLGDWSPKSVKEKAIAIDEDFFDPPPDKPMFRWDRTNLSGLEEIRATLGFETSGSISAIPFNRPMTDSRAMQSADRETILKSLQGAKPGAVITFSVNSRSGFWSPTTCAVYDLEDTYVILTIPSMELRRRFEIAVADYPEKTSFPIQARIDDNAPSQLRATLIALK